MERQNFDFSRLSDSNVHKNTGVSAGSFLRNIENGSGMDRMYLEESILEDNEDSHLKKMLEAKLAKLREEIINNSWFRDKPQDDVDVEKVPNCMNVILFGPAGSGKSSVVRTAYSALHGVFYPPEEYLNKLVIKAVYNNEGTTKFTKVEVKKAEQNILKAAGKTFEYKNPGINMFDTRGQIFYNEKEKEALNLMMDVG